MTTGVEIFDVPRRGLMFARLARRHPRGGAWFTHLFGGPPRHEGIVPAGCRLPLVSLYDFDVSDPTLGFPETVGFRRFPLYAPIFTASYSPFYRRGVVGLHVAYRVLSDKAIEVVSARTEDYDYFQDKFPQKLPERYVMVEHSGVPADDPDLALRYSGVYGWRTLSRQQLATMRPRLEAEYLVDHDQPGDDPPDKLTLEQLASYQDGAPFWQSPPRYRCPNRDCPKFRANASMQLFLLLRDHELGAGVTLPGGIGQSTRLYFLKCPSCHAVVASSEGT
jgi:hypothetical protein